MKSKLGFGKYPDIPIFKIIDMGFTRYLRGMYYCQSHIDFTEDVLAAIFIFESDKISKPGKDIEKFKKKNNQIMGNVSDDKKLKINSTFKSRQKRALKKTEQSVNLTPKMLQRINHGHT